MAPLLIRTRFRFSPQVLAWMGTFLLAFFPFREAVGAFVFWRHGPSYRQLDFVVSEVVPNEGYPYARGLLQPGGTEWNLEVEDAPAERKDAVQVGRVERRRRSLSGTSLAGPAQ